LKGGKVERGRRSSKLEGLKVVDPYSPLVKGARGIVEKG